MEPTHLITVFIGIINISLPEQTLEFPMLGNSIKFTELEFREQCKKLVKSFSLDYENTLITGKLNLLVVSIDSLGNQEKLSNQIIDL